MSDDQNTKSLEVSDELIRENSDNCESVPPDVYISDISNELSEHQSDMPYTDSLRSL